MMETQRVTSHSVVIGAGVSGVVAAKCLREAGQEVLILEKTSDVGGRWKFREDEGGVMSFTRMDVSKHNNAFSDYPFPEEAPDFPHHTVVLKYIQDYAKHFGLDGIIRFGLEVIGIEKKDGVWKITARRTNGTETLAGDENLVMFDCKFVAVATGHHSIPVMPNFRGQETFKGEFLHSCKYKDAKFNQLLGKKILIVGMENEAVDIATNASTQGSSAPVMLSCGADGWYFPNYIFGQPTDLHFCRVLLSLPWTFGTRVVETILSWVQGDPKSVGLNPKLHALQKHPTISSNIMNLLRNGDVKIVPNLQSVDGKTVKFDDGTLFDPDVIVSATGYKIGLPFLKEEIRNKILVDPDNNTIKLYKNVFCPDVGHTLGFIGLVEPASGGRIPMLEMQARWFAELVRGNIKLPEQKVMIKVIDQEVTANKERFGSSSESALLRDEITYNDELALQFGAKPSMMNHPALIPKLLFSSCGPAQWRLDGPGSYPTAEKEVSKVPISNLWQYAILVLIVLFFMLSFLWVTGFVFIDDFFDLDIID